MAVGMTPQSQPPPPPPYEPPPEPVQQIVDWAEQLGVTPQELRSALEEVGPLVLD
jgi:hypothetical protein